MCVSVPGQAVLLQASSIAPLTSCSVPENVEVIDQSHQGDGRAGFQLLQQLGKTLAHFSDSVVTHEALHLLEQCGVSSSLSLLFSLKPKARSDYATETFCSSASTRAHTDCKKAGVVGRRREDCTKQINNVMSPSHRNSILAVRLLLY